MFRSPIKHAIGLYYRLSRKTPEVAFFWLNESAPVSGFSKKEKSDRCVHARPETGADLLASWIPTHFILMSMQFQKVRKWFGTAASKRFYARCVPTNWGVYDH